MRGVSSLFSSPVCASGYYHNEPHEGMRPQTKVTPFWSEGLDTQQRCWEARRLRHQERVGVGVGMRRRQLAGSRGVDLLEPSGSRTASQAVRAAQGRG